LTAPLRAEQAAVEPVGSKERKTDAIAAQQAGQVGADAPRRGRRAQQRNYATTINGTASQAAVAALPRLCRSRALLPHAMSAFRFDAAGHSPDRL
jgi:hypothetical protein